MASAIAPPAADAARARQRPPPEAAGLGLLPAARRRHLVVRHRADRLRARPGGRATPSARTSTGRSPSSNMSGARSRRPISSPAMSAAASRAATPAPEFAGTPDRPARITGNVARNGTFLSVNIADPQGDIVATSVPARAAAPQRRRSIPPSAPMSPATPAGSTSARLSTVRVVRPQRDLADAAGSTIPTARSPG